ncbi:MAG: indole-3-glycerol phosphate synthase TrpC [Rhodospirillaceae bacterium]|nr:indole-3-glycerol phosphate synthase TrpC [Rhodospirillaceae bacterium]
MSDILEKICADKRQHIENKKSERPLAEIIDAANNANANNPTRGFINALKAKESLGQYGLIAEIKKASPSKGLIREDFNPASLAKDYENGGAACLSVLTDEPYFQGSDEYLIQARGAVSLPVLRKDFMLDAYQVYEARALGADCILLIMAALSDDAAAELEEVANKINLDVLVEVHNDIEMERALKLSTPLIGINNRNLKTLEIDTATTEELADMVPDDKMLVSESGLHTPGDLLRMKNAGASCFLIGESLMRENNVEQATRNLLTAV